MLASNMLKESKPMTTIMTETNIMTPRNMMATTTMISENNINSNQTRETAQQHYESQTNNDGDHEHKY